MCTFDLRIGFHFSDGRSNMKYGRSGLALMISATKSWEHEFVLSACNRMQHQVTLLNYLYTKFI